jgi:hypothetical protein
MKVAGCMQVHISVGFQPIACAHLCQGSLDSAQQFRFYTRQLRYFADGLGNGTGKDSVEFLKARTYVGVVYETRVENEAVCPFVTVKKAVQGTYSCLHPFLVVLRGAEGTQLMIGQGAEVSIQQLNVEFPLGQKVLVQHRLAHFGHLGNLVHAGAVIALGHEDFLSGSQEPGASLIPRRFHCSVLGRLRATCG